jgi:hypothetical protein
MNNTTDRRKSIYLSFKLWPVQVTTSSSSWLDSSQDKFHSQASSFFNKQTLNLTWEVHGNGFIQMYMKIDNGIYQRFKDVDKIFLILMKSSLLTKNMGHCVLLLCIPEQTGNFLHQFRLIFISFTDRCSCIASEL